MFRVRCLAPAGVLLLRDCEVEDERRCFSSPIVEPVGARIRMRVQLKVVHTQQVVDRTLRVVDRTLKVVDHTLMVVGRTQMAASTGDDLVKAAAVVDLEMVLCVWVARQLSVHKLPRTEKIIFFKKF